MFSNTRINLLFCFIFILIISVLTGSAALCADVATVIKLNTVMRDSPSDDAEMVLLLKKKAILALVDRDDTDGWLNVIHIKTGKEGWVKKKHVSILFSKRQNPQAVFSEEKIDEDANPEITVENASYKDLTLRVGNERFQIMKYSTKTISVVPGDHKYHASAPDVFPAIGKKSFQKGYSYTWKFWIETKWHR